MKLYNPIARIGIVLTDGFSLMSVAAAVEPLRAANHLSGQALYQYTYIQVGPKSGSLVKASCGATFDGPALSDAGYDFDLVLVAAAGNPSQLDYPDLIKYLKMLMSKRIAIGGISGGPVLLARAGVMQNRRFTVHWDHRDALREISDDLLIERSIYVIDRDRYTCAGGVAPMDMMLALIAAEHGRDLAKQVSEWFIHTDMRDASQPQRFGLAEKYNVYHPALLSALQLMQDHIADPLTSPQLAQLCAVSERHLVRLFKKHFGVGVNDFYRDLRLQHAKILIEQSSLSIFEIAIAAGFEGTSYFASVFRKKFETTPTELRRQLAGHKLV